MLNAATVAPGCTKNIKLLDIASMKKFGNYRLASRPASPILSYDLDRDGWYNLRLYRGSNNCLHVPAMTL